MRKYIKHLGITLIIAGLIVFVIRFTGGPSKINCLLFSAFALITAGIAVQIWIYKKDSKY